MTTASLPANVLVTDFRIYHDSVFCIGTQLSNDGMHTGLAGTFDIHQLFAGTGGINYVRFPATCMMGDAQITIPRRMDLYRLNGVTHIAFVGDCELYPVAGVYHRTTVCDIYRAGNTWFGEFYYNKDGDEYYTDIVTSDNYVVAVARDTHNTICYVDAFYPSGHFPSTPLFPNSTWVLADEPPIGYIRVEALSSDVFALVYQYKNGTNAGSTMKRFNVSSASINVVDSYTTPHGAAALYNNGWSANQLIFDASRNRLLFLQKTSSTAFPTNESILSQYDLATLSLGIENYSYYTEYTWNRIDLLSAGYYKKIGLTPEENLALLKEYYNCGTSCLNRGYLTYNKSVTTASIAQRNEYNAGLQLIGDDYMPVIRMIGIEPVCEFYN
ncbi:MAG: hypothetical protein J5641_05710 [Bacteroidales bacterium]|nr:hypothetical protein [Bacteroidales bacterium]